MRRCLDALMRQSVAPDEIIVVDNNSTDETAEIASSYSGVTVVSETRAQGITPARNTGIDAANGDVICRIDADTIVPPHWVASVRQHFDQRPEKLDRIYGVTGSASFNLRGPRWLQTVTGVCLLDIGFFAPTWIMLLGHPNLYGSNMAITKHAWLAVRDIVSTDDNTHEDVDLSACMIVRGGQISYARLARVLVSSRSLHETPKKVFWRIRIWFRSAYRARSL